MPKPVKGGIIKAGAAIPSKAMARSFWASPVGLACLGFLAVAAVYLWVEHRVHVIGYGPLVLFLILCGGMHFMHGRGHGRPRDRAPPPAGDGEQGGHRHG